MPRTHQTTPAAPAPARVHKYIGEGPTHEELREAAWPYLEQAVRAAATLPTAYRLLCFQCRQPRCRKRGHYNMGYAEIERAAERFARRIAERFGVPLGAPLGRSRYRSTPGFHRVSEYGGRWYWCADGSAKIGYDLWSAGDLRYERWFRHVARRALRLTLASPGPFVPRRPRRS